MAIKVIDRLFLVVYGTASPTDHEWVDYLELVERHGIERTMQLVVTDGGGPTQMQRRYLDDLLAGRNLPVAVVTGSTLVRGTITAISWFNRSIKAFPPSEVRDAMAYLEIPNGRMDLIERELHDLARELTA
jgi:hypothetical protein